MKRIINKKCFIRETKSQLNGDEVHLYIHESCVDFEPMPAPAGYIKARFKRSTYQDLLSDGLDMSTTWKDLDV